jgi:hypothetical protein
MNWSSWLKRRRWERQMHAEFQFHLENQVGDYLQQGLTREEAELRARVGEGRIVDAEQKPVPEAQVTLMPDGPANSKAALQASCRTDALGKCTLMGIAPGGYHAFAFTKTDTVDLYDPEVAGVLKDKGTPVVASESEHKAMQIQVLDSDQDN